MNIMLTDVLEWVAQHDATFHMIAHSPWAGRTGAMPSWAATVATAIAVARPGGSRSPQYQMVPARGLDLRRPH